MKLNTFQRRALASAATATGYQPEADMQFRRVLGLMNFGLVKQEFNGRFYVTDAGRAVLESSR